MFTPADTISIPTSRLKENIPDIAAITGNTLWGFSLLLSKTALNYAPTSILLSMRFIIAFLLMNLILLFKIERISLKGKNILPILLLALNDVAYFYCESYGIALTNSMFTGVVLSLIPILAMGLSALFLKEFPTLRQILFSFLPVAGVVIIILAGSSSGAIQPVGILFVLSACFLSAIQRVINRKAAVNFSAFERTYFTICSSCLFFTANAVHQLGGDAMKLLYYATIPGFIIPVLILSIFCSVTCNILVNYAAVHVCRSIISSGALWSVLLYWFGSDHIRHMACYKKKHTLIFSYLYAPAFLCYTQFKKFTVKGVYTK